MLLPPSSADLKARFLRFVAVDDGVATAALERAATQVDETWLPQDRTEGMLLYAAHLLTLDGQGTGAEAETNAEGISGFRLLRSGSLTIERFDRGAAASGSYDTTSYGVRFKALLRLNRGGSRITGTLGIV